MKGSGRVSTRESPLLSFIIKNDVVSDPRLHYGSALRTK